MSWNLLAGQPAKKGGPWVWVMLLACLVLSGCGTMRGDRGWGEDAFYPLSWHRMKHAAIDAATDPVTWIPAVGAGVFSISDWDKKTSNWAHDHTPVFASRTTATDVSDGLLRSLSYEATVSALVTPSGDEPWGWTLSKARGLGLELGITQASAYVVTEIKDGMGRERPDKVDNHSFPSGHTAGAFTYARLTNRHLDAIDMPAWERSSFKAATLASAATVGWARVEGMKHFPTDVLFGAAIGNFVTSFLHDGLMNLPDDTRFNFYVEPSPSGTAFALSFAF